MYVSKTCYSTFPESLKMYQGLVTCMHIDSLEKGTKKTKTLKKTAYITCTQAKEKALAEVYQFLKEWILPTSLCSFCHF